MNELDQLAHEAAAVDAANAPPDQQAIQQEQAAQEQAAQAVNEEAEFVGLLTIITALFMPMFPSLEKIYTPQAIQNLAGAAIPVMQKRGWSTGSLVGKWAEELTLAAVAFPLAVATYRGVNADIAAMEKAKEVEKKAAPQVESAAEGEVVSAEPEVVAGTWRDGVTGNE